MLILSFQVYVCANLKQIDVHARVRRWGGGERGLGLCNRCRLWVESKHKGWDILTSGGCGGEAVSSYAEGTATQRQRASSWRAQSHFYFVIVVSQEKRGRCCNFAREITEERASDTLSACPRVCGHPAVLSDETHAAPFPAQPREGETAPCGRRLTTSKGSPSANA